MKNFAMQIGGVKPTTALQSYDRYRKYPTRTTQVNLNLIIGTRIINQKAKTLTL